MSASNERLHDLLADRALVGLEPEEAFELEGLLRDHPDADVASFERAAAAVALATVVVEPLPSHLFARIEADAVALLAHRPPSRAPHDRAALARTAPMPGAPEKTPPPAPPIPPLRPVPYVGPGGPAPQNVQDARIRPAAPGNVQDARGRPAAPENVRDAGVHPLAPVATIRAIPPPRAAGRGLLSSGWVAAAAVLVIALGAYFARRPAPVADAPKVPSAVPAPLPPPPAPPSAAEERGALLARAGTVKTEWTATKDPAAKGATGDVVWNAREQRGYMRFSGLAQNDPRATQYQLWIFDKTRDDKYPVDGGVFDVDAASGDVVVPITARLPVAEAALFAVTVEKPGGVVVSKRERVVVTAKPLG